MNKKQSSQLFQISTPKQITKNIKNLSHNSSSSSIKSRGTNSKPTSSGKQNLSSNLIVQSKQNKTSNINQQQINANQSKGLKRIRDKIQNNTDKQKIKQMPNITLQHKTTNPKNIQKSSSNKSLLNQRKTKTQISTQSDKKLPTQKMQKSTPKSISKKGSLKKMITRKSQPQQVSTHTIQNNSQNNQTQSSKFIQSIQVTPKIQKEQVTNQSKVEQVNKKQSSGQTSRKIMIGMFKIIRKLNQGSFSTTFQVIHIQTGGLYCLKVFQKLKIKQQGLQQQIISQINFRRKSSNRNLQKMFGFFDDQIYVYFIEEYLTGFGSIQKQLHAKRKFNQKQSGVIFKEVLQIVRFIHSQSYIHRDIRLPNLVRCLGVIKLVDFSWIACLKHKKQRDTFCGTYNYAPPELLEGQNYDQSIDIWSLGILIYELSTGQSPFTDGFCKRNSHSMNFPIFLSNQLVDLIGRLLSQKGARIKIQEIMMHQWTNKWDLDGFVSKQIWDFWVL